MTEDAGKATAGNADTGAPVAGAAATTTTEPAGKAAPPQQIPSDLMPHVEKMFDDRLAKVLPQKQQEWETKQAEALRQAQLSAEQKAVEELTKLKTENAALTAKMTRNERVNEIIGKSGGKVSPLLAGALVDSWAGDWDAGKAVESAINEARTLAQNFAPAGSSVPHFPGAGGQAGTGTDALTDAEIKQAVTEKRMTLADANKLWDARAAAKAGAS